jgi:RHS repeat-associated protein
LLTDATAVVTDAYDYDAFGNLISRTGTTPNQYLYAGEQFDAHLGFYFLRARYMNPMSGRFWTEDTHEGNRFEPVTLHKYLYTGGDPVNREDPSGHDFNIQTLVIIAGVIGILAAMAVLPATYNSHFKTRSGGSEPLIEIEDQPFIAEGTGWDYSVAVAAESAAIDFWKSEANIVIKPLPLIMLPACDGSGNCSLSQHITMAMASRKPSNPGFRQRKSIPGTPLSLSIQSHHRS